MRSEHSQLSLIGDREENEDRVAILFAGGVTCLVVADGMGGHEGGAEAAEAAVDAITDAFLLERQPLLDPLGFLHLAMGRAHEAVVEIGRSLPVTERPRSTCAVCVVQNGSAYWAHVGDSRVYLLRDGQIITRTRDHTHVEDLVRKGKVTALSARHHPMRNFVEHCLGGSRDLTEMTVGRRQMLASGDVLLLCTDGVWGCFDDADIGHPFRSGAAVDESVKWLCHAAVTASAPYSDNTTAAAMRWIA